ncbi:MAG TPA: ATP-binding protein, partial [Puia sp.]|nr:ATP-binding protein [Puia sp.]
TLVSDRNILAVIVRNLVDNAVKYTISGSILVRVEKQEGGVLVQVADTGTGMSAEKVNRLLNAEQKATLESSSSFGYRFITELVRRLEGHLTIDSTPGKGTTVSIYYPALAQ